jgi:hypothetical protein
LQRVGEERHRSWPVGTGQHPGIDHAA